MIEVHELTKRYGGTLAVDALTFTVRPGVVTGFLGPNGAGKSSTMRMILDLDRPTSGRVRVAGRRYRDLAEPLRHVGALLDGPAAHGGRRAHHHLLALARSNRIPASRVGEVLRMVGLDGVARRRVRGFSLGMRQRLGIAAALLGDPPVLLLDEPVNGLDPEGIRWLRGLLRHLAAQGRTVFVSSHLMGETALVADHLVVIGRGRLLADTGVSQFVSAHAPARVRVRTPEPARLRDVLARAGIAAGLEADGSVTAERVDAARVGEIVAAHGVTVHEMAAEQPSLEDAFMRLTADATPHSASAGGAR